MKEFYNYALTRLKKIDREPKVVLKQDQENANNMFGKTGYYDPNEEKIVLFVTDRHPKDVLRSFAHELIHHHQKCNGEDKDLNLSLTAFDPAYASHDEGLRKMEKQAFRWGNMIFRDWCDMKKTQRRGEMSDKKNVLDQLTERVLARLVAEAKKMPMKKDDKDVDGDGNTTEKVPAFLDKGDVKKKKGGGKIPKQLAKYVKSKKMKEQGRKDAKEHSRHLNGGDKIKEDAAFRDLGDAEKQEAAGYSESTKHPYSSLNERKARLFDERFNEYEEWKFQELLKKAIK